MTAYDCYKDSGTKWIGLIPNSWRTTRFKFLHTGSNVGESVDKELRSNDESGIVFYTAGMNPVYTSYTDFPSEKYTGKSDLLLARNGTPYVYLPLENSAYSDHIIRVTIKEAFNKRYVRYCLQQSISSEIVDTVSLATWSVPIWDKQVLPIPQLSKQDAIADYLDKKVAHIDSVISEAKASIEEYKQWKASIIYEAVTKGLDPDAEMKDSGVEWIGKIPSKWTIMRLKYFISGYKAGPFGSALITDKLNNKGNILVYTPEHIAKKNIDLEKNLYLPDERKEEMQQFIVKAGDIIFPIVGSLGRSMLITKDMPVGIINQRLAKFRLNTEKLSMPYFLWLFSKSSFFSTYIDLNCRGSIIVNLTKQIVCDMPIPVPYNIDEQEQICNYLEEKCANIDSLISEKEYLISDLEAYKKSLIFEVVTGKQKVV